MKYIFRNLRLFYTKEKLIFILIVVCAFITGNIFCISYGIYSNYQVEKEMENYESTNLTVEFLNDYANDNYVTKERLDKCFYNFSNELIGSIDVIKVLPIVEGVPQFECFFIYKDGKYSVCNTFKDNMLFANFMNSYFTEEQENNGENVVFLYSSDSNNIFESTTPYIDSLNIETGKVLLQGKEYEIIGTQTWNYDSILVPFNSLDQKTILGNQGIFFSFNVPIDSILYDELSQVMKDELGDLIILPEIYFSEKKENEIFNTMMMISFLITIIATINISILFYYILLQREKEMAVFRLCGLNRIEVIVMYFIECFIVILPSFIFGMITFQYILFPVMVPYFKYIKNAFSIYLYFKLGLIFFIFSMVIVFITIIKRTSKKQIIEIL